MRYLRPRQNYKEHSFGRRATYLIKSQSEIKGSNMALSTIVKFKALGLAKQVVFGAFINGALIGATVVAAAVIANRSKSGNGGFRGKTAGSNAAEKS